MKTARTIATLVILGVSGAAAVSNFAADGKLKMLTPLTPVTLGAAIDQAKNACAFTELGKGNIAVRWLDPQGRVVQSSRKGSGWTKAEAATGERAANGLGSANGNPAASGLPARAFGAVEAGGQRYAVRPGRRVPGEKPTFPSAALVVSVEREGRWEDVAFADERPDAEVSSAALTVRGDRLVAAYVIRGDEHETECRVVEFSLDAKKKRAATWRELPAYPQAPGMAGPMAGQHKGALIVAGGTNWPEPGKRKWYDTIQVLAPGEKTWRSGGQLPTPRAYGAAVSLPDGVLVMGGDSGDAEEALRQDAFFMQWDGKQVKLREAAKLPVPISNPMAIALDGSVYLAGGNSGSPRLSRNEFWRLDLKKPDAGWQKLPPWPGPARSHAVMAALDGAVYLIGGLETKLGDDGKPKSTYLTDAYRFRPGKNWEKLPDLPWSCVAAPSPAPTTDSPSRVFVLGGVDGRQAGLLPKDTRVPEDIIYFDVAKHAWRLWPEPWPSSAVTIPAIKWDKEWAFITGEIMGGVRMTESWAWRIDEAAAKPQSP